MKKIKLTHTGILYGDARLPKKRVRLRETKNFWITEHGNKFRKENGWAVGQGDYPLWTLKIDTIQPISQQ